MGFVGVAMSDENQCGSNTLQTVQKENRDGNSLK